MKRFWLALCLVCVLANGVVADDTLRLSREDAKQLHAFLLTGELLDFGRRADSPGAYLMAIELMLDYPTGEFDRVGLLRLCQKAKDLSGSDDVFLSWAQRLKLRASKTERSGASSFVVKSGVLEAGAALYLPERYSAAWIQGQGLSLQRKHPVSGQIESTEALTAEDLAPGQWWVFNGAGQPTRYRLLLKRVLKAPGGSGTAE